MFFRHDSGTVPVYGPHSKDILQEPTIFSKGTFQSTKRRQRRQKETVKETTLDFFFFFAMYLHFTKTNCSVFLLEKNIFSPIQDMIIYQSASDFYVKLDGQSLSFFFWNGIWLNALLNSASSHHLYDKNKNKTAYRHLKEMTHVSKNRIALK